MLACFTAVQLDCLYRFFFPDTRWDVKDQSHLITLSGLRKPVESVGNLLVFNVINGRQDSLNTLKCLPPGATLWACLKMYDYDNECFTQWDHLCCVPLGAESHCINTSFYRNLVPVLHTTLQKDVCHCFHTLKRIVSLCSPVNNVSVAGILLCHK